MSEHSAAISPPSKSQGKDCSVTALRREKLHKHPMPQRIMHWFNAACFLFLWLTGIGLITTAGYRLTPVFYTDMMGALFGGQTNILQAHIYVGFAWFAVMFLGLVVDPWGLGLRFLRDLSFTKNDIKWFSLRLKAELDDKVELPAQGAYNAGQKAFGLSVLIGVPVIGLTGILMVFGTDGGVVAQWMVFLHLISVGGVIAFFIVHFSMATLMTEERPALVSMFSGDVTEEYARHHHEEWYENCKDKGGEYLDPLEKFGIPKATLRLANRLWNAIISRPEGGQWSPFTSGFLLGLAVLASFLLLGHGLGASGLFSRLGAYTVAFVAEDRVRANPLWGMVLDEGLRQYWLLWLGGGTLLGGFLSAALGGRIKSGVDKGDLISVRARIILAIVGGMLVGFATRLTRGCTSTQALSGGSILSTSGWVFVLAVFGGGFITAIFLRRIWR